MADVVTIAPFLLCYHLFFVHDRLFTFKELEVTHTVQVSVSVSVSLVWLKPWKQSSTSSNSVTLTTTVRISAGQSFIFRVLRNILEVQGERRTRLNDKELATTISAKYRCLFNEYLCLITCNMTEHATHLYYGAGHRSRKFCREEVKRSEVNKQSHWYY